MSSDSGADLSRRLMSKGLLIKRSAMPLVESAPDLDLLIERAVENSIRLLDDAAVRRLIEMGSKEPTSNPEDSLVDAIDAGSSPLSEIQETPQNEPGRVIAPITPNEIAPPPRPHGLDHYSLQDFPLQAKDVDTEIDIHFDITGNSVTEGRLIDMQSCFMDRLSKIRKMIIESSIPRLPRRPIRVSEAWAERKSRNSSATEVTLIGLVEFKRFGKNGDIQFAIEDESGSVECVLYSKPEWEKPEYRYHPVKDGLLDDDVLGVTGYFTESGRLRATDLHRPGLEYREKARAGSHAAVSVAFLSDIHVGSKTFLAPQWEKMIQWFKEDPLAKNIRYFVMTGDGVDGIGIYPGQERHLQIKDLYKQYGELARMVEALPDWVDTIILPGNHDAVRPAEPQPALDPEVQQDYSDVTFAGNPSDFSLHGVRVLAYHGVSISDFVSSLRSVTFEHPERAMMAMLERRHLAPSWGGKTPLSPEPEDSMVIQTIPDIFVTGHVHGHHASQYKGTHVIHSSTWQNQTDYQRMLGFQPRPCILTIVNLDTHAVASVPFV
ncbi:MAG: metallophosphoesterase [Candidatus Thalassarchaeaceae archaeon]